MLPITNGTALPDRHNLKIADEHLECVLRGEAYLLFDGAMGTMLQREGLVAGELPELLCLTHPEKITAIHAAYVQAGSQVVTTNTFGANARKLGDAADVSAVFEAAIACARASGARYVAADVGPTGALLKPMGTLSFDEAYELFAEQMDTAQEYGADLVIIETMTDLLEMKAAVLAAKEHTSLPIFATMTFEDTGRTFLGTDPVTAALTLEALGVQALGINCSLGPAALAPLAIQMLEAVSCPVMVQANAGLPELVDGQTLYSVGAADYVAAILPIIEAGANILGGCCGTDPSYIALMADQLAGRIPQQESAPATFTLTSAQKTLRLKGSEIAVIGERINPTGKKKLQAALRDDNYDYIAGEAISQTEAGADILDVNVGLPELDEPAVLAELVGRIQAVSSLPLQIDSSDPAAVEAAVRVYAGIPLINSVNGKKESLEAILPIAAHYGCAVVGLTLDEDGIPSTAQGRFEIAQRIVDEAQHYGIDARRIAIDCLVMAAATNQQEVLEILRAVSLVKQKLGVRTVLGVSNVSFGLPARAVVNATFLAAAFGAGLDMPILNPLDVRYAEVVDTWRVLCAQDKNSQGFIERYANYAGEINAGRKVSGASSVSEAADTTATDGAQQTDAGAQLFDLVLKGDKGAVSGVVETLLGTTEPLDVINNHLIPALDEVGQRFEVGTFFLPQLMASAEAAKAGFDIIRTKFGSTAEGKGSIALATVKGDIHDIGKNIVKMLLENYGYNVYDLGRDVDPQDILDFVLEHNCDIVGLSALMTTTVPNMEATIKLLHEKAPGVKVMVGGAVLSQAYADAIGADFYGKDAAQSATFAAEIIS